MSRSRDLHRATVKSQLHSFHICIRENPVQAVVIDDFYTQVNARCHDFGGAGGLKIYGITRLLPRFDGASGGFASDLVSIRDKATAELFGKLSKTDLIALFNEDFAALVSARRPGPVQIEGARL